MVILRSSWAAALVPRCGNFSCIQLCLSSCLEPGASWITSFWPTKLLLFKPRSFQWPHL